MFYYAKEFVKQLQQSESIVIYGARIVAKEVSTCLMADPYNFKIDSFIVSSLENNPTELNGVPVINFEDGKKQYLHSTVLVAVLERYLDEICQQLDEAGFKNVIALGFESDLWNEVRGNSYRYLREKEGRPYLTIEEELGKILCTNVSDKNDAVHIYMAKCHVDKPISKDLSEYDWEIPIQVGAALTEEVISDIRDNIGDNISQKNKQYCELTALYWIWKNDISKYKGLCHYRRHFDLDKKMLSQLTESDIDVVLTIPILNFPSVREMYCNYHCKEDWDILMEAIRELQPAYLETANRMQNGVYYYAYNMLIAKEDIFNNYCEWLFPILDYCNRKCGIKEDGYQNRYIGFMAERLLSIYFLHHEEDYKIVHATKTFLWK